MAELKYEIVENLGSLGENAKRLEQGSQPDQLERKGTEVRYS